MNKILKFLIMDVDGTLTDGKIYMGNDGEVCKVFDIRDGCGIHDILLPIGIIPIIITGRTSKILQNRCSEIGITEIFQGVDNKHLKLNEILFKTGYTYSNVAYMGDDINDLSCMIPIKQSGGIVGCPYNAVKRVRDLADYICEKKGGDGAVREFIEWLLYSN